MHHGKNDAYLDKNFGTTFILWDRLFGTFQEETEKPVYGPVSYTHLDVYKRQLLYQNRLMGVSGVPYYIINDKYAVSGAQPTDLFLQALPDIAVKAPIQAPTQGEACDLETGVC